MLLILVVLFGSAVGDTYAQQNPDSVWTRTAQIEMVNRAALPLDLSIRALKLSESEVSKAARAGAETSPNVGQLVDSVSIWGDEPSSRTERWRWNTVPATQAKATYDLSLSSGDSNLFRLLVRYQAVKIYRPMSPATYDTVAVARDGRLVPQHDNSLWFNIVFPDSMSRNAFLEEAARLPSVNDAYKLPPPSAVQLDYDQVPPNDLNGDNTFQWNLVRGQDYGIEVLDAWSMMNDLGVDEESVEIAFIEPNVGPQTLSEIEHSDLIANLTAVSSAEDQYFNRHLLVVTSVAGARTDNGQGIAGATYNTPVYAHQTNDSPSELAEAIRQSDSDVINLAWHYHRDYGIIRNNITDQITSGTVVVASTGSGDEWGQDCSKGQCI
jgi:hypothetical protein